MVDDDDEVVDGEMWLWTAGVLDDEVTEGLDCLGQDLIQQRMFNQKNIDTDTKETLNQAGTNKKLTAWKIKLFKKRRQLF